MLRDGRVGVKRDGDAPALPCDLHVKAREGNC
jgi:hypothetical protein